MTVLSVACHGCTVLDDPTGSTSWQSTTAKAVDTTDGRITFDVTMQFNPTGRVASLTGTATRDHEIAVEATCALILSGVRPKSGRASGHRTRAPGARVMSRSYAWREICSPPAHVDN